MKRLSFIICFFIPFVAFAAIQADTVITINHLPANGALLNKGWKFQAGDAAEWARTDYNDSKWLRVDPARDVTGFPSIPRSGIGWLRLHLALDSNVLRDQLA